MYRSVEVNCGDRKLNLLIWNVWSWYSLNWQVSEHFWSTLIKSNNGFGARKNNVLCLFIISFIISTSSCMLLKGNQILKILEIVKCCCCTYCGLFALLRFNVISPNTHFVFSSVYQWKSCCVFCREHGLSPHHDLNVTTHWCGKWIHYSASPLRHFFSCLDGCRGLKRLF